MPLSFEDWQELVDKKILELTDNEVGLDDLPDGPFDLWNSWDSGDSAERAARKVIKNAGGIGSW